MADRRDQRDGRRRGRAHHDLLVEGPEIFQATAAARHDQHVRPRHRAFGRQLVEAGNRRGHLTRRPLALHGDLASAEPKRLRYRVLHTAARLTHGQRHRWLRIALTWPWADQITAAFTRITAIPAPG